MDFHHFYLWLSLSLSHTHTQTPTLFPQLADLVIWYMCITNWLMKASNLNFLWHIHFNLWLSLISLSLSLSHEHIHMLSPFPQCWEEIYHATQNYRTCRCHSMYITKSEMGILLVISWMYPFFYWTRFSLYLQWLGQRRIRTLKSEGEEEGKGGG